MTDYAHGVGSVPGVKTEVTSQVRRFLKISDPVVKYGIAIPSDVVDSGNTPTTKLRPGLILVKVINGGANDGKYVQVGHTDAPVANDIVADGAGAVILAEFANMLGDDGTAEEKHKQAYISCYPEESQLIFGTTTQAIIDAIKAALPQCQFL